MMSDSILRKPLTGLLLLAGAAGGPYVFYETDVGKQGLKAWHSASDGLSATSGAPGLDTWSGLNESLFNLPGGYQSNAVYSDASKRGSASGLPLGSGPIPVNNSADLQKAADPFRPNVGAMNQLPVVTLAEILRFDITPEWVMGRFPRVTTLLSEMNLDGLRTPLITGTSPSDMAGTLTYYFDRYKRLKRVSVQGIVGDPTRYVMELQQAYQMTQEPSLGGALYVTKWNGTATSILHVAPAAVVYSDLPYGRYNLFLELNQADLEFGLSAEARQLIEAGRHTKRW